DRLIRRRPLAVPIQIFDPLSRSMVRTWESSDPCGSVTALNVVPFQRKTPWSVPTNSSLLLIGSMQLIFLCGSPVLVVGAPPPLNAKSPAFSVPIQILPSGVAATVMTGDDPGRSVGGASDSTPFLRKRRMPLLTSANTTAPLCSFHNAVTWEA